MSNKRMKIGIMGFGRIGRDFYRLAQKHDELDIVVISDIGRAEILHYLLQIDGMDDDVKLEGNFLISGKSKSRIINGVEPRDIPWDMFDVDLVVDATHKYCSRHQMQEYIDSGAKRVVISALPRDDVDRLIVMGVNDSEIKKEDKLISAGSSTTNTLALMLSVLSKAHKINQVMMTTIHAYTSDQPLQDTVGRDFRRSRSAAENIIPNVSPTPQWIGKILPEFKDKVAGIALNVPVPRGSCLDLSLFFDSSDITIDAVNKTMKDAAAKMPRLIDVTEDPIVSSDVLGNEHTLLFDSQATMKTKSRIVKTIAWYDNGLAHASRILDIVLAYKNLDDKGGVK
ncbi:MAG: glyceraldehyde-3-phosphate dehydrogenase [FCB group bacterium]|nr:glyceraldehyde-3-phosphate dehydrogenase [FCB group bacterium]